MKKWYVTTLLAVLILIALSIATNIQKNRLYDQNAAERWDEGMAMISMIYPVRSNPTDEMYFPSLAHKIESGLESSSIADTLNPDEEGIAFLQSLSVEGKLEISSDRGKATPDVIGVDGDFFTVHPLELIYGSYIDGDDLMKDGIVIDEDCAWNLFGAFDVVGKQVEINGVPHYIRGVVHKPDDRFSRAAGMDRSMCFVSMDSLKAFGTVTGSYDYEVIIPNPVENFADTIINTALGNDTDILVINNTDRFNTGKMWKIVKNFGIRSMNEKGIVFPYYENVARAWEDVFAALLIIKIICFLVLTICIACLLFTFRNWFKRFMKAFKEEIYEKIKEKIVPVAGSGDDSSGDRVRKRKRQRQK